MLHRDWDARRLRPCCEPASITSWAPFAISTRWKQWRNSTAGHSTGSLPWSANSTPFSRYEPFVTISRNGSAASPLIDSFATPEFTNHRCRMPSGVSMITNKPCKSITSVTFSWSGKSGWIVWIIALPLP